MKMTRWILSGLILIFQIGAIIYARFAPMRYFCWAPYDTISVYSVDVDIADKSLSEDEIKQRYRLGSYGKDSRSIHHIMKILEQYEKTYGSHDKANITLKYTVNGKEERHWIWVD